MSREYVITSPYWTISDSAASYDTGSDSSELSRHADDLYKLLLRRLTSFELMTHLTQEDISSLRAVFEEFVMISRMNKVDDSR